VKNYDSYGFFRGKQIVSIRNGSEKRFRSGEGWRPDRAIGSGKTTLLEILAGKISADSGKMETPNSVTRRYLPQEIGITDGGSLFGYAMSGMKELIDLRAGIELVHKKLSEFRDDSRLLSELGNMQDRFDSELGNMQDRFEAAGGYEMETKTKNVLTGVGFKSHEFDMDMNKLSGGQRNRAALAGILISEPDLLFLDEPTNHLDISGLERYFRVA
jgi:ATP-binding cassette subfamily F protein 3